jgi:2-amino-4-hydroxy-6-hydroxymethyldihydropteridine diphosphokinase
MDQYFLALGSNLGDREANLKTAVRELAKHGVTVIRAASIYSTEPKERVDQPWFLNTVIEVRTSLVPDDLMRVCLAIEADCGRQRSEPNAPRTLDIDIILRGQHVENTEHVTIPHPRYAERRFVVAPLAELAPDMVDPIRHQTIAEIMCHLADDAEVRVAGPPLV